jgi:hypothetical protein
LIYNKDTPGIAYIKKGGSIVAATYVTQAPKVLLPLAFYVTEDAVFG